MKNSESFITRNLTQESEKITNSYYKSENSLNSDCISRWNNYSFDYYIPNNLAIIQKSSKTIGSKGGLSKYSLCYKPSYSNRSQRLSPLKIGRNIQTASIDSKIIAKLLNTKEKRNSSKIINRTDNNKRNREKILKISARFKPEKSGQNSNTLSIQDKSRSRKAVKHIHRYSENLFEFLNNP